MEEHSHNLRHALYGIRTLIFIEDTPQSNKYRQVIVGPKKYKKISDAISQGKIKGKDGDLQIVAIEMSDELYNLPDLTELDDGLQE